MYRTTRQGGGVHATGHAVHQDARRFVPDKPFATRRERDAPCGTPVNLVVWERSLEHRIFHARSVVGSSLESSVGQRHTLMVTNRVVSVGLVLTVVACAGRTTSTSARASTMAHRE